MKDVLLLFFYSLTFIFGISSLTTFLYTTIKTYNKLFIRILFFYLNFTLLILLLVSKNYLKINLYQYYDQFKLPIHYLFSLFDYLTYLSGVLLIHYLFSKKYRRYANLVIIPILTICYVMEFLSIIGINLNPIIFFQTQEEDFLADIISNLIIIYLLVVSIIKYSSIQKSEYKGLLKNLIISVAVFLPGIIFDVFNTKYFVIFSPIFYCVISTLLLRFILKYYNKNYYISDVDTKDINNEFLKKYDITKREKEIILLIIKGYNNKKIADSIFVSINTVKTHIYNIYSKLNINNRYELMYLVKNSY